MKHLIFTFIFLTGLFFACTNSNSKSEVTYSDSTKIKADSALSAAIVVFNVSGMTCTGCENAIQGNVAKLDGIKSVKASHTEQKAVVTYDSTKVSVSQIAEAITNTGYTVVSSEKQK